MNSRYRLSTFVPGLLGAILICQAAAGQLPDAVNPQTLDRQVDQALYEIISRGAEIYNNGDPAGCCRLFEGALMTAQPVLAHYPTLQTAIAKDLAKARDIPKAEERAHALRAVLDGVRAGLRPVAAAPPSKTVKTTPVKPPSVPAELVLSPRERTLLDLVNQERAKKNLTPLRPSAQLFAAARSHSANMAAQDKLSHELDGQGPGERFKAIGHAGFNWGENVAAGYANPADAMAGWMSSEGHRDNILNPDFTEIGIGIASDNRGTPFYTQDFGGGPRGR